MDDEKSRDLLKIDDAARYLGVTRRWIYRRIGNGELPASKVGGFYFVLKQDLEALLEQGRRGGASPESDTPKAPILKCGYCFRLLETDTAIGEICRAEGCEEIICDQCLAEGNVYCFQHVPNREQLWQTALEQHRAGELPVLLKDNMARLREVSFIQRIQTRLGNIHTLRHPLSDDLLTIQNWDVFLEERDERSEIMKMTNKVVLDADWVSRTPLNVSIYYQVVTPAPKQKIAPMGVLVQVYSHARAMLQQGFDSQPFNADELTQFLLRIGEQAQKKQVFTLVMLAATTGWDETSRRLIRGETTGLAFAHRWMLVYLNDLEKHEVIYNRLDSRARAYGELFTSLLPDEEDEEIIVAIEKEMGVYESLTLQQAVQVLPYSQKSLERAFSKMAASGRYALTEVPGFGQTIVRT